MRLLSSRFFHRKAKSEGDAGVTTVFAPIRSVFRTNSAEQVFARSVIDSVVIDFTSPPVPEPPASSAAPPPLPSTNIVVATLAAQVAQLKETNEFLLSELDFKSSELMDAQSALWDDRFSMINLKRDAEKNKQRLASQDAQLASNKQLLDLMNTIGLGRTVLEDAIQAGEDAGDVLIRAVKAASTQPTSVWNQIIPAITGPRTPEHYTAAIGLTIQLRKDLKTTRKVVKFWKGRAQEEGRHVDTITPSPSNISSIFAPSLSSERQTALDDLRERRNKGEHQYRRLIVDYKPVTSSLLATQPTSASEEPPLDVAYTSESTSTIRAPYVPNLPPLASQSFKEELAISHSLHKIFAAKSVLGEVDRNVPSASVSTSTTGSLVGKLSAKALGKRKAIVLSQSIESVQAVQIATLSKKISATAIADTVAIPSLFFDNPGFDSLVSIAPIPFESTPAKVQVCSIQDGSICTGNTTEGSSDLAAFPSDFSLAAHSISTAPSTPSPTPTKSVNKDKSVLGSAIRRLTFTSKLPRISPQVSSNTSPAPVLVPSKGSRIPSPVKRNNAARDITSLPAPAPRRSGPVVTRLPRFTGSGMIASGKRAVRRISYILN